MEKLWGTVARGKGGNHTGIVDNCLRGWPKPSEWGKGARSRSHYWISGPEVGHAYSILHVF